MVLRWGLTCRDIHCCSIPDSPFDPIWHVSANLGTALGARLRLDEIFGRDRHSHCLETPNPVLSKGILLGNGDVGFCVTVRPDGLGLHIGKEDSWDIRVSEDLYQQVLRFDELK
jgi:hypothetical protein